jgi:hypothetical protein
MLRGVLKAAGSAETVDVELIENGDFSGTWTGEIPEQWTVTGTVDGNNYIVKDDANNRVQVVSVYGYIGIKQASTVPTQTGKLYKRIADVFAVTSGGARIELGGTSTTDITTSGVNTAYSIGVPDNNTMYVQRAVSNSNFVVSSVSLKQVLTPSALGATIVSAKGGTTYNFGYKNPTFTYNAASYYVVIKALR